MRRKLLIVLIALIFSSSLNSALTDSHTVTAGYGSEFTLEVKVDKTPAIEQVIYNVSLHLRIDEIDSSVFKINQIRLYAKMKSESYEFTNYKEAEEEVYKLPNSPKSVNASFSFDLTNITEDVTVYFSASLNEYIFEDTYKTTCTVWFIAQTITLETTEQVNYVGYLSVVVTMALLVIIKRLRK